MTSQKEKSYIFWLAFFFLVFMGLLAGLVYLITKQKHSSTETCLTKQCTLTASMLIEAMDTTVDPCDNFYAFACANFIRNNPVPVNEDFRGAVWTFTEKFDLQMKNLVEGMGSLQGPKVMYRMQEAYHVCLNITYDREKEFAAFKNFTQKELNWPIAWPTLWRKRFNSFSDYLADYEEKGLYNTFAYIRVLTTEDEDNITSPYKVMIDDVWKYSFIQRYGVDDNKNELGKKMFQRGLQFFRDLVHLLGNQDDDVIDRDLEHIQNLINYYGEMTKPKEHSQDDDITDSPSNTTVSPPQIGLQTRTFREVHRLTGGKINWLHIVNKKMRGRYEFKEDDVVFVNDLEMYDNLRHILERFNLRTLVNILGWEAFSGVLENAGPEVEELYTTYQAELNDIQTDGNDDDENEDEEHSAPNPRWKKCLDSMHANFMLVVTRMFLEAYVDRNDKKAADEMIQLIQEAYKDAIRKSPWLDEKTRNNAIKKADAIKRYVGYPDFIFDDKALDNKYKKVLPVIHSTHFENSLEISTEQRYNRLVTIDDNSVETEDWNLSPLIVNAFYALWKNSIMFPSAILQLPFFQHNRLAAMNFGMIGAIIGHEIGHAFDNQGSRFDDKGNHINWWSNSTREEFDKRGECFVKQYNTYCPEFLKGIENETDVCVKGEMTLGENMADYTGISASFEAYKLWTKKHGAEKRLPGLNEYSPEQLFFISNAYMYCENIPPHKWLEMYQWNPHSPGKYRVLGVNSNSAIFREAFKCPVGAMNRGAESCQVW